eukprot:GFYU01043394.1.p1 GENE.GFYU01043394.1~~GFYU01043394.1.p1  ORF type:complete len:212 (-),score=21.72 GFYU01043394.1:70-681(-)
MQRFAAAVCVLAVVVFSASPASAQYSHAVLDCSPNELILPINSTESTMYFSAAVNDIMSFEFQLTPVDGRPLGWMELYDFDEDDDTQVNYDCYVASTTSTGACENVYLAVGETSPQYINRNIKVGFQKCPHWDASVHSAQIKVAMKYVEVELSTPTLPVCTGVTHITPTEFCNREGGASAVFTTAAMWLLVFVATAVFAVPML